VAGLVLDVARASIAGHPRLGELLRAAGDTPSGEPLPAIDPPALELAHHLRVGWPVIGVDRVTALRDALDVERLPMYLALRHLHAFVRHLEAAWEMLDGPPLAPVVLARSAVSEGLLSICSRYGFTSPQHKWLVHWCHVLQAAGTAREVVGHGLELLVRSPELSERRARRQLLIDLEGFSTALHACEVPRPRSAHAHHNGSDHQRR
jgi:hypothetical protein